MDAPARPRAAWQAAAAVLIGLAAALGVLSSQLARHRGAGDGAARRARRLLLRGLAAAGVRRPHGRAGAADRPGPMAARRRCPARRSSGAPPGRSIQVLWSLRRLALRRPRRRRAGSGWDTAAAARAALRANFTLRSHAARHALRFGAALAVGVAALPPLRTPRPRLLGAADDPLRDAPRARRELPPDRPARGRHRGRPGHRHRARRSWSTPTSSTGSCSAIAIGVRASAC